MKEVKKVIFMILGILCLILALIGGMLPIMPGAIFLVIAGVFFAKGSTKFNNWLKKTKIYKKYLKKYIGKHIDDNNKDD
ncbi:uncharacterized membrane protein YbaN (DUF454 family) [Clostridium moniliforme]|uniref:Uncharacterized membrane protein YbaN (DUF454 family) n=1 Tax=Clostridium moniliforme TaxID=39489 RepID=A0ABS4EXD8_9CLOT|nr:DUF454 family protein [Clostridium moniliforme]MBP1888669.1 uncharacterized membrane protein YbaN (DUF454 family) [Clostridium moniliforme]